MSQLLAGEELILPVNFFIIILLQASCQDHCIPWKVRLFTGIYLERLAGQEDSNNRIPVGWMGEGDKRSFSGKDPAPNAQFLGI